MGANKLKIISYNCRGFKTRNYEYIKDLYKKCNFLLIQETWLYDFQSNDIINVLSNSMCHSVSSMESNDVGRQGRPYGGVAIIWNKHLPLEVHPVQTSNHRIACVTVTSKILKLILFNVYMPVDNGTQTSFIEFCDILDEISSLMKIYDSYQCVIGGDLNINFDKLNSINVTACKRFIDVESFECTAYKYNSNLIFTYESPEGGRSVIDHFLFYETLNIINFETLIDGSNLSDHNPIVIEFDCFIQEYSKTYKKSNCNGVHWNKVTKDHVKLYKETLDMLLRGISVSEELCLCDDFQCNKHHTEINKLLNEVNDAITIASDFSMPKNSKDSNKKGSLPGWNDYVRPYKEQSIMFSNLWKDNGCLIGDEFDRNRKLAKSQYHRAIKYVKANRDDIIKSKISNKLCQKNFSEFWREIRKIKNNKINYPSVVDGALGDTQISNLFHDQYKNLYNSYIITDNDCVDKYIRNNIDECKNEKCKFNHKITEANVKEAVKNLKPDKNDYIFNLSSNHFLDGTDLLYSLLSFLFNAFLTHGFTTFEFNSSIILPLPKSNKKSLNSSSNYRAISINVVLCKLLEYVLSSFLKKFISTSNYQFGYKNDLSTNLCTFVTGQTIKYYLNGNSNVYALFLDASKAFDKVKHSTLYKTLIDKNICPIILRMIILMYKNNNAKIKWNNDYSGVFRMTNGTKQGGVLSPYLFTLYLDPLINTIKNSGYGCHIGKTPYNIFAYADDVVILSPTLTALNKLIKLCEIYSKNFLLNFNITKSEVVIFSKSKIMKSNKPVIFMNGQMLNVNDSYKHLGIVLSNSCDKNLINFDSIINDMKVRCNVLKSEFFNQSYSVKTKLFNSHCMSLYGCPLWDIECENFKAIQVTWRKCCRSLLGLPNRTHNIIIPNLIQSPPIDEMISMRTMNFVINGLQNKNEIVKNIFRNSFLSNYSNLGKIINNCCKKLSVNYVNLFDVNMKKVKLDQKDNVEKWKIGFIIEILKIKDNCLESFLTKDELNAILYFLCTM